MFGLIYLAIAVPVFAWVMYRATRSYIRREPNFWSRGDRWY